MTPKHLLKVKLDEEDLELLDRIKLARKLTKSDTIRALIREEHHRIVVSTRFIAANG